MGWSSGSDLAEQLWSIVSEHIPVDKRKAVAKRIIRAFENHDCDTMHEAEDLWIASGRKIEE